MSNKKIVVNDNYKFIISIAFPPANGKIDRYLYSLFCMTPKDSLSVSAELHIQSNSAGIYNEYSQNKTLCLISG